MLGAWCGKKRPRKKAGHLEDRTLSDVAEVKNFDSGSKGRVSSGINVSPPKKINSRESLKDDGKGKLC